MSLDKCYNFDDFQKLAKRNLPAPIYHYIAGGSDDETTLKHTESFLKCDLVPNILASVGQPDLSTKVLGTKIDMPLFLSQLLCKDFIITKNESLCKELLKSLDIFMLAASV